MQEVNTHKFFESNKLCIIQSMWSFSLIIYVDRYIGLILSYEILNLNLFVSAIVSAVLCNVLSQPGTLNLKNIMKKGGNGFLFYNLKFSHKWIQLFVCINFICDR